MDRNKKWIFTGIFIVLIMASLVCIELVLRLANYGLDTKPFHQLKYLPGFTVDNKSFRNKYYNRPIDLSSHPIKNMFATEKTPAILRGFVIGGSTAEGFPFYSNHSFSQMLEAAIKKAGVFRSVEVLNMGFSAMSSYYDRDVVQKLLAYKPDFIILYSGHNEYYGTISATTGGNYITKSLYLTLKELKLFQLLLNLVGGSHNKESAVNRTMMAERFNNKTLPHSGTLDKTVAENYIRNLNAIIKVCNSKDIKVLVVDPACNLLDMPPFAGSDDTTLSNTIADGLKTIKAGNPLAIKQLQVSLSSIISSNSNANALYLYALCNSRLSNKDDLSSFIKAKDQDLVPFRARSELTLALEEYAKKVMKKYPSFYYIPLSSLFLKKYGSEAFGKQFFIDHVHYTMKGNIALSEILARKIGEIYQFDKTAFDKLDQFYQNDKNVEKAIHYLPINEYFAYQSIKILSKQPPFSTMLVPFTTVIPANNPYPNDKEIAGSTEEAAFNKLMNDSLAKNDVSNTLLILSSVMQIYRAEPKNYLALAQLQEIMKNPDAGFNYAVAYLLSGKSRETYDQLKNFYTSQGESEKFRAIIQKYGEPE